MFNKMIICYKLVKGIVNLRIFFAKKFEIKNYLEYLEI